MQVFRLVNPGYVDKMIAFDSLPKRLLQGLKMKELDGYPRYWKAWLKDNGATRRVKRWSAEVDQYVEIDESFTYMIDTLINEDKEKWQAITNYVRRAVDLSVRLLDKIDDMAVRVAKDSYSELSLEPEQVPIIPVPLELAPKPEPARIIRPKETVEEAAVPVVAEAPKRRGRQKKVAVEA